MVMRLLLVLFSLSVLGHGSYGKELTFQPGASLLRVHIPKAGLLSFAGHEHIVDATDFHGVLQLTESGKIPESMELEISVAGLEVMDRALDSEDRAKVRANMLDTKVLSAETHPEIRFSSEQIDVKSDDQWVARGTLSIRGLNVETIVPVSIKWLSDGRLQASGWVKLSLADFGIKPVAALAGMVRTGKTVSIEFQLISNLPEKDQPQ